MTRSPMQIRVKYMKEQELWKPQFGGEAAPDMDNVISVNKVAVKAVNLVIKSNGTEVVRRRWEWDTQTNLEDGDYSTNIKVSEHGIEFS